MKRELLITLCMLSMLAACVPQQQYQQEVQQVQQLEYLNSTYQQLNQQLQSEVNADQVQIKQLSNRLQVTMVDRILYPEGGWELHRKGKETLSKIVPSLQGLTGKQVTVEGYTDNLPIEEPMRRRFPSNWELSAFRATEVVRFLQAQGIDPSMLAAAGLGEYHPVASNDTPEGRSRNRRINIVIQDANGQSSVLAPASPPPATGSY